MEEIKFGKLKVNEEIKFGKLKVDVIKIGEIEDLTTELTQQDTLITTQDTKIENIITALQGKTGGTGSISLQEKTVSPTINQQEVTADSGYNGLSKVTVNAVDSSIDSDIKPENIRKGVDILNVVGTMEEYVEPKLQSKNAIPTTEEQTINADDGFDGLSSVSISAVDNTIDENIKAENIKKGIKILEVEGTLEEGITPSGEIEITENGTYNVTEFASANVNIEGKEDLETELTEQNTLLSEQEVTIDDILEVLKDKMVNVNGTLEITENGEYDVSTYEKANVNVIPDTTNEDGLIDNTLTGTYTNNRVKTIALHRFRATNISVFNSTSVTRINSYAFYQSTKLEECNTPNLENLQEVNIFYSCSNLKRANFPKLNSVIGANTFYGCKAISYVNLGNATQIGTGAFQNCTNLSVLVLPKTSITALNSTGAFNGSSIANGTGYVYVPDDLVETYKTATNWSTYADQIKGLSELPEGVLIDE